VNNGVSFGAAVLPAGAGARVSVVVGEIAGPTVWRLVAVGAAPGTKVAGTSTGAVVGALACQARTARIPKIAAAARRAVAAIARPSGSVGSTWTRMT
jgi:hypothetical protein